jgi:hypothetical protein
MVVDEEAPLLGGGGVGSGSTNIVRFQVDEAVDETMEETSFPAVSDEGGGGCNLWVCRQWRGFRNRHHASAHHPEAADDRKREDHLMLYCTLAVVGEFKRK